MNASEGDGAMVVLNKGSSAESVEQAQRVLRVGRKRNDGPLIQPKAEPYYRQFDKRR